MPEGLDSNSREVTMRSVRAQLLVMSVMLSPEIQCDRILNFLASPYHNQAVVANERKVVR